MADRGSYEPGTPSWVDIGSTDLEATHASYTGLFGWQRPSQMPAEVPPYWNIYFGTSDVDTAVRPVEALGGHVLAPPFDVPDVGRMATSAGALGETFSLFPF